MIQTLAIIYLVVALFAIAFSAGEETLGKTAATLCGAAVVVDIILGAVIAVAVIA